MKFYQVFFFQCRKLLKKDERNCSLYSYLEIHLSVLEAVHVYLFTTCPFHALDCKADRRRCCRDYKRTPIKFT